MRESTECLSPYDTEVTNTSLVYFGEDAVEYITEEMATEPGNDSLATFITMTC
jgi:hypothetical protein